MTGFLALVGWTAFGTLVFLVLDCALNLYVELTQRYFDPRPRCECGTFKDVTGHPDEGHIYGCPRFRS